MDELTSDTKIENKIIKRFTMEVTEFLVRLIIKRSQHLFIMHNIGIKCYLNVSHSINMPWHYT